MKTAFAFLAWMVAAVATAGDFTIIDRIDELDGSRELAVGMQCDDQKTAGIVVARTGNNTYGLGVIDTGFRIWVPDNFMNGPIKAARYRGDNMDKVRSVEMTITKKMLVVQVTKDEAIEILRAGKFMLAVDGERFTVEIGQNRSEADRAIGLIQSDISAK